MNFESLSQVVFSTRFRVASAQLATTLHPRLAGGLASAHLFAAAEAAAIDAPHLAIDAATHTVLGAGLGMRHVAPAAPGAEVVLDGWVRRLADSAPARVEMVVVARADGRALAEIELHLAIVERRQLQQRLHRLRRPVAPSPDACYAATASAGARQRARSVSHLARAASRCRSFTWP